MNTIFDFKRAGLLIQRHFIEKFQGELMFWGISIVCMMFIRNTIPALVCFAMITCVFRTGLFFKEIHSPTNRINYFMIPATQIEKFVVSLLYTIVYFWVMMFTVYAIGNILGTWVNNLLANIDLLSDMFNIRQHNINIQWVVFGTINLWGIFPYMISQSTFVVVILFLIVQSIFFLGSIYFKRNQILKTCLALIIISFFLFFLTAFEMKYFVIDKITGMQAPRNISSPDDKIMEIIKVTTGIFYYLLIPYLWITSYIRLSEKEV